MAHSALLCGKLKTVSSCTSVLILPHETSQHRMLDCVKAGADGYLFKDISTSELMDAIHMIHKGRCAFNRSVTSSIRAPVGHLENEPLLSRGKLRSRELEVLRLTAGGMTNKEIASELGISTYTVATHFINIFKKLHVQSRIEAVIWALKEGLIRINGAPFGGKYG